MTEVDLQNSGISNDVVAPANTITNNNTAMSTTDGKQLSIDGEKKEKKRAPFGIFKAALFMMRRPSNEQKKKLTKSSQAQTEVDPNEKWKKLVGSMRPLHLQDNQSPPPSCKGLSPSPTAESLEDLVRQPSSSSFASSPSSVSCGMSQYASAGNLQELDEPDSSDEEDDPDEVFDAIRGDEMIDAKAEEFIARFYQQMKLQHVGAVNPQNHPMGHGQG